MDFVTARRHRKTVSDFRDLAVRYWESVENVDLGNDRWMAPETPLWRDTPASLPLRRQLSEALPAVLAAVAGLDAQLEASSYPPPAIGGPIARFNFLQCVCETWVGHQHVSPGAVRDALDRALGAAKLKEDQAKRRLLNPIYWFIDIPAAVVSVPFLILRNAGVPPKVIEHWATTLVEKVLGASLSLTAFAAAAWQAVQWVLGLF